ncbi:MAG: rhodanese-like domain-containing protein [Campylobacterota bacterium]|nr:rhodanese-like domain-containing protein [Campylobacterota bacterium]
MSKILLLLIMLGSLLFADVQHVVATPDFFKKGIKVIDIRTPGEWRETGIVQGAHTVMFFNEQGGYNVEEFITELNKIVKKDETFALICRTGSRTTMISDFLDKEFGYKVINLKGGMMKLMREGYKPALYRK